MALHSRSVRRRLAVLSALLVLAAGAAPARAAESARAVSFPNSCAAAAQAPFERGVALLHAFAFDAATTAFTAAARADQACAMAQWGLALAALDDPFAGPPSPAALSRGGLAVERARVAGAATARERDYVEAVATLYRDSETVAHALRAAAYERAMETLADRYPDDREAAVFHALALEMTDDPADTTSARRLRAAAILEPIAAAEPRHPGATHYLVHAYDTPRFAERGLEAARRLAALAPPSAHARHVASHIFLRRGVWEDSIAVNVAATKVARGPAERLHALDAIVYAALQRGDDRAAAALVRDAARSRRRPGAADGAAAWALAAIPARHALERHAWSDAAGLAPAPDYPWARFPEAEAVTVFARVLGGARSGRAGVARGELPHLDDLRATLAERGATAAADEVRLQRQIGAAWVAWAEGRRDEGLRALRAAAVAQDARDTPVVPAAALVSARVLLGEMLLEARQPAAALVEFETAQQREPNRFRALHGAALAAARAGLTAKAREYYTALLALATAGTTRPEIAEARAFLGR